MEGRDVEHFLTAHPPLAAHVKVFKDNGFETLEMLALATEADLQHLGLPLGHRRLLQHVFFCRASCQSKLPEQIQLRDEEAGKAKRLMKKGEEQWRFIFDTSRMQDFQTFADLEMEDGDVIDAYIEQVGDIGHFGLHLSSPGSALLSSSSAALGGSREEVVCVLEHVCRESVRGKLREGAGGRCDSVLGEQQEPQWHAPSQGLPSEQQRIALMHMLDERWKMQQQQQQQDRYQEAGASAGDALSASSPAIPFADFKVELSLSELESLVGVESVARLVSLFGGRVDQVKLRRVSAGSHGRGHGGEQDGRLDSCCIPFHLNESELTLQLIPPCPLSCAPAHPTLPPAASAHSSLPPALCPLPPVPAHSPAATCLRLPSTPPSSSTPPAPAHSSLPPVPCLRSPSTPASSSLPLPPCPLPQLTPPAPCLLPQLTPPCPQPPSPCPSSLFSAPSCPLPQVALNSPEDYTCGALVFLLPRTASALVPSRCPGSATVHDNSVVHGDGDAIAAHLKKAYGSRLPATWHEAISKLPEQIQLRDEEAGKAKRLVNEEQWRFIFDGSRLDESRTIAQLELEDGDIIDFVIYQAGDIGHLGLNLSSPGAALLSSSSAALEGSKEEVAGASAGDALSASSPVDPFADFKVELSRSELESVVGAESVSRLMSLFGGRVDQVKLRRVSAGSHGGEQDGRLGIPFHLDEAELTMQVALNSPFQLTPPCPFPPAPGCPPAPRPRLPSSPPSSSLLPAPCPCPLPQLTPPASPCPLPQVALNSPKDYTGGALVFLLPRTASALVPSRRDANAVAVQLKKVHRSRLPASWHEAIVKQAIPNLMTQTLYLITRLCTS
eukprot:gene1227-32569_t